jgi:hypothetical protein
MSQAPKKQITLMLLSVALALFSLASIITFTDPYESSWLTHSFFYLSLFILLLGSLTVAGLALRQWLTHNLYVVNFSHSFRQAVLISLLLVISLILKANGLMFWWVEGSLILFLIFVEILANLKI